MKVTTTTLDHQQEERTTKIVSGLEIPGLEELFFLHLQPLLSIDNLPVSIKDIPTQQDIAQCSEFADLYIPSAEAEVKILIGNDNRHTIQPFEVINSDHGHHTLRTVVEWVVNCTKRDLTFPR